MKVVYLTWGETPRSYGVFGSQVIAQFVATKKRLPDSQFYFISAVPVVNSGMIREKMNYVRELDLVGRGFEGIHFSLIPIYAPQNFINSNIKTFKFMHMGAHWHLANKLNSLRPDIVHCRSYHAAWAALRVKEKANFKYKVIFDARGLWPEEVALKKGLSENDKNYIFLKGIEKYILSHADSTVAVSDPMVKHFAAIGANRIDKVYLSASVNQLNRSQRNQQSIGCFTLGYVGALSGSTWHQPKFLFDLYRKVRKELGNTRLVVATTSSHVAIRREFNDLADGELVLTSTRTIEELAEVLEGIDVCALTYFMPNNEREVLLSKMVLAVKTAEYLAAGLPVLVNKYCGGAAAIISEYDLGIAYNPYTFEEITAEKLRNLCKSGVSNRAKEISLTLFDYESNANRYADLYKSICKN